MSNALNVDSLGDKRKRTDGAEGGSTVHSLRRSSIFDRGILDQIDLTIDSSEYASADNEESGNTTDRDDGILQFSTPRFDTVTPSMSASPRSSTPLSRNNDHALRPILTESPAYKLRKSRPYAQLQDVSVNASKLHRIYSESETNKFDSINGRRMYDDDKYRPYKIKHINPPSPSLSRSRFQSARSFTIGNFDDTSYKANTAIPAGMEDEYIPDFDFSVALQQWEDSYYPQSNEVDTSIDSSSIGESLPSSSLISRPQTPVGESHAQVQPVSVPVPKKDRHYDGEGLDPDEELIASKIPQDFTDLPFSVRRKVLADLMPLANQDVINKVIKKRFKKKQKSSPALQFLSSFSERSSKLTNEGNTIMDHKLGRIIGFGAWGVVRECRSPRGDVKAIKIIRTKSEPVKEFFRRELNIWRSLKHDCILPLLDSKEEDEALFCLMDKITGGTLFDLVSKWGLYNSSTQTITMDQRLRIVKRYSLQIISALMYMHSRGIVHGDVKLENVLIDLSIAGTRTLLCDFGMSLRYMTPNESEDILLSDNNTKIKRRPSIPRSVSGTVISSPKFKSLQQITTNKSLVHDDTRLNIHLDTSPSKKKPSKFIATPYQFETEHKSDDRNIPHSHIGSLPYAAPELLESSPPPLGPSADVWAFGVMLYTMIVGKLPFQHSYEPRLRAMISSGRYDLESLKLASKNNENFIKAISGCLTVDLTKRMDLSTVNDLIKGTIL